MKFMMMILIVAVGAFTADAQYFKSRGSVYDPQDTATHYLLRKYIHTKWFYATPASTAYIESPIVRKKLQSYQYSSRQGEGAMAFSIDKANRYNRKRPWQQMYLRPLLEFAYSLYEPQYMPTGN
jgi:hypothetical protein